MPVLEVTHLGKAFVRYSSEWKRMAGWFGIPVQPVQAHWVLRDASFSVRQGEAVGLVGRNGAGKSTLLKLIAGTLRPSEGNVHVHGRLAAILELGMGFNVEFTGRQNAAHSAGLMGFDREEIEVAMPAIERFAEIGEYFDQPTRVYSSGMQMRVAFAVATAFTPDLLLIDEALAVGDLSFQAKCFARIEAMRDQGCALLFVSHSVEEIVKHCERALFVNDGALIADGSSRDVANLYLEHLWGKRREAQNPAAALPADFLDADGNERYAGRPYYRKEEHRWGDGRAAIADFHLESEGERFPTPLRSGSQLLIVMHVIFKDDIDVPVYGLLIKTHDGIFLFGTNSRMAADVPPAPAKAGSVVSVEFIVSLGLNTGSFLISLGVSSEQPDGELVPLDRRYDSMLVRVVHAKPIWGLVDLGARCHVLEGTTGAGD